mmetsp:Transcript_19305/g.61165  ORF Transcript_19305/g.61165 Transcript_19305/m.61165 type:complete len:300 (-) Transcript_19305:179-1078(-)
MASISLRRVLARHSRALRELHSASSPAASVGADTPLTYFSAWFCPFAHRATIALEHHHIPYDWQESLGWTVRPSTVGEDGRSEEAAYHWKSPELIAANPAGMVPTLRDPASGRVVKESLVAVEFIDDLAAERGSSTPSLMPGDAFGRAHARVWAPWVNAKCCSPYYSVLCKQDRAEQREAFDDLVHNLRTFSRELKGPFFYGEHLSLVDIALLPWAARFYVFEHYRGADFAVPRDGELAKYHTWLEAALAMPAVSSTCPGHDEYIEHIKKYATNSARSKVANAVRRGVGAHEYDDDKDA